MLCCCATVRVETEFDFIRIHMLEAQEFWMLSSLLPILRVAWSSLEQNLTSALLHGLVPLISSQ